MAVCAPLMPFALAVRICMASAVAGGDHSWVLDLFPVGPDGRAAKAAVEGFSGEFVVHASSSQSGIPTYVAFAVNSGPVARIAGRHIWQLQVDGRSDPRWAASFLQL